MDATIYQKTTAASIAIKSLEDETGWFEGYASTYDKDLENDRMLKGAFRRTLSHKGGQAIPVLLNHNKDLIAGFNYEAREDATGLWVKGRLNLDTEAGRMAHHLLKASVETEGAAGLSIGFQVPSGGRKTNTLGGFDYSEVALKEYSVTPWPCNPTAQPSEVKEAKAEAKTKRVAGEDLTADCFAYVGDADKTETWKLPIKFSSDAKTERHIRNALARFGQTQGIPDSERAAVLAKIRRAAKEHGIDTGKSAKDFNDSLAEAQAMAPLYEERCEIERALCDATQDALDDDTMSADDKKADITASYEQYAAAMSDWYSRFIDADTDNDTEEDLDEMDKHEKTGRAISAASAQQIKTAMGHLMDAGAMHQKALGILTDLSKSPYTANDVNADNPVGGGKSEAEELAEKAAVEAAVLAAKAKEDQEKSDSDKLHSLLELTRSVATNVKKAA